MCNYPAVKSRLDYEASKKCPFSIQEKQAALIAINAAQVLANENDKKYLKDIAKKLKVVIDSELETVGAK